MQDLDVSKEFAQFLVEHGHITPEQARIAIAASQRSADPIGRMALRRCWLTIKQVSTILGEQIDTGLRFGEQAIQLGLLTPLQVRELLHEQRAGRLGLSEVLFSMGVLKKGELRKLRREFLHSLETALV